MKAKYNMTVEQNIFIAKRNIIDYIWKSAKLEGIGVTFPDTEAIYNGLTVPNMKIDDMIAINNLKHAWQFVLNTIDYPIDFSYISKVNQLIGGNNLIYEAGFIRKVPVSIGGTAWKPDLPIESIIKEDIKDIVKIKEATERAVYLMLYLMRKQIYIDGNKRTGMLAANQVMIANGAGIISVPIEKQRDFTKLLIDFYESNKADVIKKFIYDKCIDGISFEKEKEIKKKRKNELEI